MLQLPVFVCMNLNVFNVLDPRHIILLSHLQNFRNSEMLNSVFIGMKCTGNFHLQFVCVKSTVRTHISRKEEQKNCSVTRLIYLCAWENLNLRL